jgi:hypothetical protein
LKAVDAFLSKSQPTDKLLSNLQHMIDGRSSKPFFHRWLDLWRDRNQGVKH